MYTKKVGKYLYACHNYLKDGKQFTKSFGRITEEEANLINKGETPSRLETVFEEWYSHNIIFHYRGREKLVEDFPSDRERTLEADLERSSMLLKKATQKLDNIYQWMNDVEEENIPNKPSMRPKVMVKKVLTPLLNI